MQAGANNMMQPADNNNERRGNPMRIPVWGTAAFLLLLPLVAMQFTREVNWTGSDFAVMGVMLLTACCFYELGVWLSGDIAYRGGFAVAVAASFLLVWVNLAVGIIGQEKENDIANLLFLGVLATWVAGGLIARFRPREMTYAVIAAAVVQAGIGAFAMAAGWGNEAAISGVLFCSMWLTSAALFRKASEPALDKTLRKLEVHSILTYQFMVNGAVMLAWMISLESEAGLIPLLTIAFGIAWNLFTRYRIRNHLKQTS